MDCQKHEAVTSEIKALKDNMEEVFSRLRALEVTTGKFEEIVSRLEKSFEKLAFSIDEKFRLLEIKIENLKSKPGERWEKFVDILIAAVVGGVIGYFIKKVG
jgi:predicted nuclease with TOPRIM domain